MSCAISFGDSEPTPFTAISWEQFKSSYLPANVCTLNLTQGVIKLDVTDQGVTYDWVVDPEHFTFTTGRLIPSTGLSLNTAQQGLSSLTTDVGVGMVSVPSVSVAPDRKSVVSGKGVSARVDLGDRRSIKKKNSHTITQ